MRISFRVFKRERGKGRRLFRIYIPMHFNYIEWIRSEKMYDGIFSPVLKFVDNSVLVNK